MTSTAPVIKDISDALHDVKAILRAHHDEADRNGVLSGAAVDALIEADLLKMWQPKSLGGLECAPLNYIGIAEDIAAADTAAAWLMMSVATTTFDLRFASEELVDEIYARPDPIVCETFNRPMNAVAVDDGYSVSGQTPFASNCRLADWIGHTALDGERMLLVFHPRDVLEIHDDWHTTGMRGTSSNTIAAEEVYVPAHRVIDLSSGPVRNRWFAAPLYQLPEAVITATFSPVSLGSLRSALDYTAKLAREKTAFAAKSRQLENRLAQYRFGRALAAYRAARAYVHAELGRLDGYLSSPRSMPLRERADLFLALTHVLQTVVAAVDELSIVAGTSSVFSSNILAQSLNDVRVIAQHAFGADARYASVAQAYFDIEVDFPLMQMD